MAPQPVEIRSGQHDHDRGRVSALHYEMRGQGSIEFPWKQQQFATHIDSTWRLAQTTRSLVAEALIGGAMHTL